MIFVVLTAGVTGRNNNADPIGLNHNLKTSSSTSTTDFTVVLIILKMIRLLGTQNSE